MGILHSSGPRSEARTAAMFSMQADGRPIGAVRTCHINHRATEKTRKKREIPQIAVVSSRHSEGNGCGRDVALVGLTQVQRPKRSRPRAGQFDLIPTDESTYWQRCQRGRLDHGNRVSAFRQEAPGSQLVQRTTVMLTQSIVTKERSQVGAIQPNGRDISPERRQSTTTLQHLRFNGDPATAPRSDQSKLSTQFRSQSSDNPSHSAPIASHGRRSNQITPGIRNRITLRLGDNEQFGIKRQMRI